MNRLILGLAMVLCVPAASLADLITYDFTFTGSGGMDATGTISVLDGVAQSGSVIVTGAPVEAAPNTLISMAGSLLPASGATDAENHNGDVITYDNLVNVANDPTLNGNGLGFGSGPYQDSTHYNTLINLWGNSPGSYTLFVGEASLDGSGNVIDAEYVYAMQNGSFTITPVPEPSTFVLLGIGAVSLLCYAWRKRTRTA